VEPLYLHLAAQLNRETGMVEGAEKTAFAWVPLGELLLAVSEAGRRYFLARRTQERARLGAPWRSRMQLHPCFASSLRLAMEMGLEAHVTATCGTTSGRVAVPRLAPQLSPAASLRAPPCGEGKAKARAARKAQPHHMTYWLQQEAVKATLAAPAAT